MTMQGGLRYPGALLGIFAGLVVLRYPQFKIRLPALVDAEAVAIPFGFAAMRAGCYLQGCCFGDVCDLPWAVSFPPGTTAWQVHRLEGFIPRDAAASLAVHPLQLYFAAWLIVVGLFLLWFRRHQAYTGQLGLLFLALHEPGKWLLEFLRHQSAPPVQLFSGVVGLGAIVALYCLHARRDRAGGYPGNYRGRVAACPPGNDNLSTTRALGHTSPSVPAALPDREERPAQREGQF